MKKVWQRALALALLCLVALPLLANEAGAWERYAQGLEALLDGEENTAETIFRELIEKYPDTSAAVQARERLELLAGKLDRGGIVSFYLGQLGTAVGISAMVTQFLLPDPWAGDEVVVGVGGLAGVGLGIWSAYLLADGAHVSFGQDLWIEGLESVALANYNFAWAIVADRGFITDPQVGGRINAAGNILVSLGSRALLWNAVRGDPLAPDKPFLMLNTYAWSQFYYWVAYGGILEREADWLAYGMAIALPDALMWGSGVVWGNMRWSLERTGLVTVGGIGGLAVGTFVNMIINVDDSRIASSVMLGSALAGKLLGAYFTRGYEPVGNQRAALRLLPVIDDNGVGVAATIDLP